MDESSRRLGEAAGPMRVFGGDLKSLRDDAGLSVRELAKRANLSKSAVSEAEQGARLPTVPVLRAYLVGLGIDETEIEFWQERARTIRPRRTTHDPISPVDPIRSDNPAQATSVERPERHIPDGRPESTESALPDPPSRRSPVPSIEMVEGGNADRGARQASQHPTGQSRLASLDRRVAAAVGVVAVAVIGVAYTLGRVHNFESNTAPADTPRVSTSQDVAFTSSKSMSSQGAALSATLIDPSAPASNVQRSIDSSPEATARSVAVDVSTAPAPQASPDTSTDTAPAKTEQQQLPSGTAETDEPITATQPESQPPLQEAVTTQATQPKTDQEKQATVPAIPRENPTPSLIDPPVGPTVSGGNCSGNLIGTHDHPVDGVVIASTLIYYDKQSGNNCALLRKRVDVGEESYVGLTLCNTEGSCATDRDYYPQEAGPVTVYGKDMCITFAISVLKPDRTAWLLSPQKSGLSHCK